MQRRLGDVEPGDPARSAAPYLIVPGWGGSGPAHWQTHWERALGAHRVEMPDWDAPRAADWVRALDEAIRGVEVAPVLIAHSLGCIAVARWAASTARPVRGALLVAPSDLDREGCPDVLRGFAPVPRARLPFPARVVASDNDPYAALPRAQQMAADWGAAVTVLPGAGHINVASGHGPWQDGLRLLDRIEASDRVS